MKKLSIITINFNNRDGLRKTIESVVNQTWQEFEYIIIDGGSTDGSVEVIQEYADRIDYWVSEPDKGIYHAMNKGVAVAKGEYCQFLNSGDSLSDVDALNQILFELNNTDIVFAQMRFTNNQIVYTVPHNITMQRLYTHSLPHPSSFIKRELLRKWPYDESLKIVSDWKFWIQALIFGECSYKVVPRTIVDFDTTGISANNTHPSRVLADYFSNLHGSSYTDTPYDKLFIEIRQRKYRQPIYRFVVTLLRFVALFVSSARFVRNYPRKLK